MRDFNKPIIEYFPDFLEYCKVEKKLSIKSLENYTRFLDQFIIWLNKTKRKNLLPNELSVNNIQEYKDYLSHKTSFQSKKPLNINTQNYYLISLRQLLSYFIDINVKSISPYEIKLLKEEKNKGYKNNNKYFISKKINKLVKSPDISKERGLRDKAILETLIYTGFKVSQLSSLNKNDVESNIYLPKRVKLSLKKYLKTRNDKENALFINYRGKKPGTRLSVRTIERIVKKYINKLRLPLFITPETLRNIFILNLLESQENKTIIKNPQYHKFLFIHSYKTNKYKINKQKSLSIFQPWHKIESIINKEILWLKENIPTLSESYKNNPLSINNENILRKIAILIVSGKITATEYKTKQYDLWDGFTKKQNLEKFIKRHGEEWHKDMMNVVFNYFKLQNYKVFPEPIMNYGRADLGVRLNSKETIYIETGTVSLFKIWYNLSTMKNIILLIVPFENYAIEFRT